MNIAIRIVLVLISLTCVASASNIEVTAVGGYFWRPVDDGINFDGPGTGAIIALKMPHNWYAEADLLISKGEEVNDSDFSHYRRSWTLASTTIGVYKRWVTGRYAWFAGGGLQTQGGTGKSEFTYLTRDENNVLREFTEHTPYNPSSGTGLAFKSGAIVSINKRLGIRWEMEFLPALIPNVGTSIGLNWSF